MKKMLSKIVKMLGYDSKTVWGRYMKFIMPCVMVVILAMDFVIYAIIANYTDKSSNAASERTVKLLADDISEVFHRYLGDLTMMRHYYDKSSREEFLTFARSFTNEYSNTYSYVRLIFPDGTSYSSIDGNDKYDVKTGRPYKNLVTEGKNLSVNTAHWSNLVQDYVYSMTLPVKNEKDSVLAMIAAVFPADIIDQKLYTFTSDTSEYFVLVDDEDLVRVCRAGHAFSTDMATIMGSRYADLEQNYAAGKNRVVKEMGNSGHWTMREIDGQEIVLHYAVIPDTPWSVAHLTQKRIIAQDVTLTFWVLLLTTLIAMIVVLFAVRFITARVVIRPLESINRFSNDFAQGKLYSTETRNITANNEIGEVCKNIEKMQQRLVSVVGGIHETSSDLSQCSRNVINTVQNLNRDAQIQGVAVESIASSVEQVNDSIKLNTKDAVRTRDNSEGIASDIAILTKATSDTYDCMQTIVQKVAIINEITAQTDLLAINAAVEATRAGDEGTGFAVVAAEIRKLSEHCHRASTEINKLSEVSLAAMKETVDLVGNISPRIYDNAEMVSRIADACNRQLESTSAISEAVQQITESSINNSMSADKMTVYANTLVNDVVRLNKLVDFFRLDFERDNQRAQLASAIETCTAEILRLKSKLIEVADEEYDEETKKIEERIDEAIESARETTAMLQS